MLSDFDLEGKNKIQKAVYYLKYYGLLYTFKKILKKLGISIREESEYMIWCRRNKASKGELKAQRTNDLSSRFSFVIVSEGKADFHKAGWMKQTCSRISFAEITEDADISSLLEQYREDYFVFSGKEICVLPEYLYEIAKAAAGCCESKVSKIRPKNPSLPDLIYTEIGRASCRERV